MLGVAPRRLATNFADRERNAPEDPFYDDRMSWTVRIAAVALLLAGCGLSESGKVVSTYVGHIHAGRDDQAYAMLTSDQRAALSQVQWKASMSTSMLADAQDVSVEGIRTFDPGGTCVYTQLDFQAHPDQGPYGHCIFYLKEEAEGVRVYHMQTYDRIDGEGLVKTGHFDETREPFPCSAKRP